jgi:hypothetical protein
MLGAAPYLWMGKERIEHEFKYKNIPNEDLFQEVLDMANEAQSVMINGTIKILEKQGRDLSIERINSELARNASKIIMWYVHVLS